MQNLRVNVSETTEADVNSVIQIVAYTILF